MVFVFRTNYREMKQNNILTVVVPVYNEECNMDRLEKELSAFVEISSVPSCILFVNDGSTDASQQKLEAMCERHEAFSFIQFRQNCGLSAAIKAGIDQAETPLVGYIDADLQTTPEDFNKLLPFVNDFALVTGIRVNRKDSFVKKLSSKLANSIRRSITHDGASDTGCPLKIMQTPVARKIPFFDGMHRFLPALIQLEEGIVKEVPVRHFPRVAGESKFHLWNRLGGPLKDLFAYRWMKNRYIRYEIKKRG